MTDFQIFSQIFHYILRTSWLTQKLEFSFQKLQDVLFQLPDFHTILLIAPHAMPNTEVWVGFENRLMYKVTRSNEVTIMLLQHSRCNGKYLTQNKYFKSSFITIFTTSFNVAENVFWSINTGQTARDTNSPPRH